MKVLGNFLLDGGGVSSASNIVGLIFQIQKIDKSLGLFKETHLKNSRY